jgi:MOSC domain-containing protein YiiM
MWEGKVVSIHIAPAASAAMQSIGEARAVPGRGLEGDRYFAGIGHFSPAPSEGGRDITLIEIESVEALGMNLPAAGMRRNIVTSGVPLNHLVNHEFRVGTVRLRGTRLCEPCSHLEKLTQPGVLKELIHRGGLRAQILSEGIIRAGDAVRPGAS